MQCPEQRNMLAELHPHWVEAQGWVASIYIKYYQLAIRQSPTTNLPEMISAKYFHTYDVVRWMKEIARQLIEAKIIESESLLSLLITALIHDIARPLQAIKTGIYKDQANFNHGEIGANMIETSSLRDKGIPEFAQIIAAVRQHGEIKAKDNHFLTLALRDADKMASFAEIEIASLKSYPSSTIGFSKDVLSCFLAGTRISTNQIKTRADRIVFLFSWYFDLNFDVTRQLFFQEKIDQRGLKILEKALFSKKTDESTDSESKHLKIFQQIKDVVTAWRTELGIE